MSFSIGMRSWSALDAFALRRIRAFSAASARRDGAPLDEAWWQRALASEPGGSRFGMQGPVSGAASFAIEEVVDRMLLLSLWKRRHPGAVQSCWIAPFGIRGEGGLTWAAFEGDGVRVVLGSAIPLLDNWPGVYDDDDARAYEARGARAFAALDRANPGDDDAYVGAEYALYYLLHEAWERCLPVGVWW